MSDQPVGVAPGRLATSAWEDLQRTARENLANTALPDRTNEAWHYGDPRKFVAEGLEVANAVGATGRSPVVDLARWISGDARVAPTIESDFFAAQHFAYSEPPQQIHLKKNEAAGEQHIHLIAEEGGYVSAQTLLLTAEPFSSAEIYLHCYGGQDMARDLHSVMVFAEIGDGARVSVTRVQHYAGRADAILREYATIGRDAQYASNVIQLGGHNVRSEAHLRLSQPGASAILRGAYLAGGRQRFDFLTHQNHAAPHTTSNLLYKGALLGRARASYAGMITVGEDAQRTDAYQSNRALVLSGSARADSSPQLEIGSNDVRCTHGSTVSNVSESEMFYMQSRGIPRQIARRLLIEAFVAEVTDQIASEKVRALVARYLAGLAE